LRQYNKYYFKARYKEDREKRRLRLTPSHKYFIQYVGEHLELDSSVVEDFVLDSAEVMQAFNILLLKSL